ncbi:MAG: trigger factor [Halobacteriovoraceae bacterium]|nr:trigger factor [Halobacteriovoraceae bacterium]|tara:strand:- start:255222 stop:256505 length:1284 start_codon:yes stop_codon:yes gene_type:complete
MAYTVEEVNGCTKKFKFNFEDVDLGSQIQAALKEKQKSANLKGFRKGKAPLAMIQQVYGPQVENDALYRFVSEEFYKAVQEEKIRPVGYPNFGNTNFEGGKKVSFEATVETFPEVEVKDYSKYSFKKEDDSINEDDVKELKDRYLAPKSEMVEVQDEKAKLEKGQFAVFNFEGEKPDGTRPDNMKAEEFVLEIGSGQFIPGFEDAMIGMKKGEKKTIELTFPKDYHEADLKGADVKFDVELLEIKEKKVPEMTDELAKEFGFESVEDFDKKNRERLQNQKKREVQAKLQEQILEKLIEENDFDVPNALIEQQKQAVREDLGNNLKQQGFNDEMVKTYFEKWDEDVTQKATFQVKSGLILDKISKKYEVEATDADLDAKIQEMADQSGMEKAQLEQYYKSNEQIKQNLLYAIREEKTFEKLIQDMKVK